MNAVIRLDGKVPASFLQALRAKELGPQDVEMLARMDYSFKPEMGFFSLHNELRTHVQLLSSVEQIMGVYPTTLKEDLSFLREATPLSHTHTALSYRIAMKRVLHTIMIRCFDRLRNVFSDLSSRWNGEVDKVDKDALTAEQIAELKSWEAEFSEWQASNTEYDNEWKTWVAESVYDKFLVPAGEIKNE